MKGAMTQVFRVVTNFRVPCDILPLDKAKKRNKGKHQYRSSVLSHGDYCIDFWRLLAITGDYWRLLEITGDYWRLLEITGDYWRVFAFL